MPLFANLMAGLVVLAFLALAVRSLWKHHKQGGGCVGCSGGCAGCHGDCHCSDAAGD